MKIKLAMLVLAGIMCVGLAGCGDNTSVKYALIVNEASEETKSCSEDVWEGLQEYVLGKTEKCKKFTPEGTERKDFESAIEDAVDNGAKVVVCIGEEAEVAVSEAQLDYTRVNFILLNGTPHKRYSNRDNFRENTIALYFNETQQGFVLGYTAVMNGYRNIGCMGGAETETDLKIAAGFVQGVEAAGVKLGLAEDDIQLHYTFTGVDKLSPVYMSKAMDWYKDGCEIIFTLDEGVQLSVLEAAKVQSGLLLSVNPDSLEGSERIITASDLDYAGAVIRQINLIEGETFVGAQVVNCGVKEGGVKMIVENRGFSDNTIQEYNTMCKNLSEGTLKVEETMVLPTTRITSIIKE